MAELSTASCSRRVTRAREKKKRKILTFYLWHRPRNPERQTFFLNAALTMYIFTPKALMYVISKIKVDKHVKPR
jgi:hypothetical protein